MSEQHEEASTGLKRDTAVQNFLEPFKELIENDDVTEIAVNKPGVVWYESNSTWSSTPHRVTDEKIQQLGNTVAVFSAQKWDRTHPLLSAALPSGARIQFVRDPAVEQGNTSFTMRKPIKLARSLDDFSAAGLFKEIRPMQASLLPHEQMLKDLLTARNYEQFLRLAVKARMNIVVAGAT